jgi:Glycosyl transferases group 1
MTEVYVAQEEPTQVSICALLRHLAGEIPTLRDDERLEVTDEVPSWMRPAHVDDNHEHERALDRPMRQERLPTVAYLLPGLPPEGSGGSHSLVQEARGLRALGASATVCVPEQSLRTVTALYGNDDEVFATYAEDPLAGGSGETSVLDAVAPADVVVATEYPSVDLLARLALERPEATCAYYVQDYEPLFAAPETSRSDRALLSYRAIGDQLLFAKTHWLRSVVRELHGVSVAKVQPSLDRELFNARGRPESTRQLRIAAMIRPRTPRRRPAATLDALAAIDGALGESAEVITFGCDEDSFAQLEGHAVTAVRHLGLLSRREVAELMRRCDVFIDGSAYQAFGRTGLEAMACGAVPVLPALGGVHEYALDGVNALVLADGSPEAIADVVIELAHDPDRLRRMRAAGISAARGFSIERAASSQLDLFSAAVQRRRMARGVLAA